MEWELSDTGLQLLHPCTATFSPPPAPWIHQDSLSTASQTPKAPFWAPQAQLEAPHTPGSPYREGLDGFPFLRGLDLVRQQPGGERGAGQQRKNSVLSEINPVMGFSLKTSTHHKTKAQIKPQTTPKPYRNPFINDPAPHRAPEDPPTATPRPPGSHSPLQLLVELLAEGADAVPVQLLVQRAGGLVCGRHKGGLSPGPGQTTPTTPKTPSPPPLLTDASLQRLGLHPGPGSPPGRPQPRSRPRRRLSGAPPRRPPAAGP